MIGTNHLLGRPSLLGKFNWDWGLKIAVTLRIHGKSLCMSNCLYPTNLLTFITTALQGTPSCGPVSIRGGGDGGTTRHSNERTQGDMCPTDDRGCGHRAGSGQLISCDYHVISVAIIIYRSWGVHRLQPSSVLSSRRSSKKHSHDPTSKLGMYFTTCVGPIENFTCYRRYIKVVEGHTVWACFRG